MMNNYDAIVVGAGNGGLVSALSLAKDGYKVLLLDEHNNIGGSSKRIVKGRFEFDYSLFNLFINSNNYLNSINNILNECEVKEKIDFVAAKKFCKIFTPEKQLELPFGKEAFIKKIVELVPETENSINTFFELASECREAMEYVVKNRDNIDFDFVKEEYNNFMRVSTYSLSKVLDTIEMPLEAQELLISLWMILGNTETELSFVTYAIFILNILEYGIMIPVSGTRSIAMALLDEFLAQGGDLKLNSKVSKIIVDDGIVNGVKVSDGVVYYGNKVIVNSNIDKVYGSLINQELVPREVLMNVNKRELGGRPFTINIGLNRSAEEIGLDNFIYIISVSLDSDIEFNRMQEIGSRNEVAIVHSNVNGSSDGTCYLSISTIYFSSCFNSYVNKESYYNDLNELALNLINKFQKYTNTNILDFIEEIEIVSPIDNAAFNGCSDGAAYGYKLTINDDFLPRLFNRNNEKYIKGLYLCGGFDGDIYGYNSSYFSGLMVAQDVKKELKGE